MAKSNKHNNTLRKILAALLSLTVVVTSGWVGDGLKGDCLFQPWLACGTGCSALLWRPLAAAVLFGLSLYGLYRTAKGLLPIRHLAPTPDVRGHQVLIAALSPFTPQPNFEAGKWVVAEATADGKSITLSGNLDNDIAAFSDMDWRWNGQQFLRAMRPHLQSHSLTNMVLIGSSGHSGSFDSRDKAEQLAKLYAPSLKVHCHPEAVDFEGIEAMQQAFDHWIEHFLAAGIDEKEIILDATGGKKTNSISAALTTLRWERIEFQYVQTDGNDPHVIGFNVVVESAQTALGA